MNVVITDCNYDPDQPSPVFVEMTRRLASAGVQLSVDNCWSDDYADADLLIGADPLPDNEVLLNSRILGQRTLNRFTRLEVAAEVDGPVARFCSPADDDELGRRSHDWGDLAVLKFDWSMRRNGVFLWPLRTPRKPFPVDFKGGVDLFMEFLPSDPLTYKIDAFGGQMLGAWILPTRDMREPRWQIISDPDVSRFEPPEQTREAIGTISRHLLRFGAGYCSFDLMRAGKGFKIIEMNSCGVGTSVWKFWPQQYAANYAQGILNALANLDDIPRYRALRALALQEKNDLAAVVLKPRSPADGGASPAKAGEAYEDSAERMLLDELLRTERMQRRRSTKHWQDAAARLLAHARSTVPYYADRLDCLFARDETIDWDRWQEVPFVTGKDFAENREQMLSRRLPPIYGAVTHWGSTGVGSVQLTITRSHVQFLVDGVLLTRLYHWHQIPPGASMATLLSAEETAQRGESWTPFWWSNDRGTEHHGDSALPPPEQLRWLEKLGEIYLRTTPSILQELCAALDHPSSQVMPALKGILTNDVVTDDLRTLCRNKFGCEIIDCYWRPEVGVVALRCPASNVYHVQSESCLVEFVGTDGRPCSAGEIGEVVVTAFYSYAMPVIRYRTGELAELPPAEGDFTQFCSCGRTLPGIARFFRPASGEDASSTGPVSSSN